MDGEGCSTTTAGEDAGILAVWSDELLADIYAAASRWRALANLGWFRFVADKRDAEHLAEAVEEFFQSAHEVVESVAKARQSGFKVLDETYSAVLHELTQVVYRIRGEWDSDMTEEEKQIVVTRYAEDTLRPAVVELYKLMRLPPPRFDDGD